jgi:threonine synthase
VRAASGSPLAATTPTTAVSGLQVGDPPDGDLVLQALKASDGWAVAVSDAEVYAAQQRLAREEAIFAEPAGAAALAGLLADASAGRISLGDVVACLITGSGFKDPAQLASRTLPPVLDVDELDELGTLAEESLTRTASTR